MTPMSSTEPEARHPNTVPRYAHEHEPWLSVCVEVATYQGSA